MKFKSLALKMVLPGLLLWFMGLYLVTPYFVSATPTATFVSRFGGHDRASTMHVQGMAYNTVNNKIYTTDSNGTNFIIIYNLDGTYFGKFALPNGDVTNYLDTAPNGNIYVTGGSSKVYVFDTNNQLVTSWGSSGNGNGQFTGAYDIKYSPFNNRVYVSEVSDGKVQIFDSTGTYISSWNSGIIAPFLAVSPVDGTVYAAYAFSSTQGIISFDADGNLLSTWTTAAGTGDGQFSGGVGGLAILPSGNVLAIDKGNRRVQVFQSNGTFLNKFGSSGILDGQFDAASGIAVVPSSGDIYVGDNVQNISTIRPNRVEVFDSSFAYKSQFTSSIPAADGMFEDAEAMITDADGNLYVTDSHNGRIEVFDKDGNFIRTFGSKGSGNGQFNFPSALAISPINGHLYIYDGSNSRIQIFTTDGTFISILGSAGTGDGQLSFGEGLSFDPDGNLYVAEENNNRISVFDKDGNFLRKWGSAGSGNGQFDFLDSLVYSPITNHVYAMDGSNYRVQVFGTDGTFITSWGTNGTGNGQFGYSESITLDAAGNVYVTDSENNRVQVFDKDGNFIATWGSSGNGDSEFDYPLATAVYGSTIYVSDWANGTGNTIRIFDFDLIALPPVIASPSDNQSVEGTLTTISGTAENGASISVTEGGNPVCTTTANGSGSWSCSVSIAAIGTHTISAIQTDTSGNVSSAATRTFSIAAARHNSSGSIPSGGGSGFILNNTQPIVQPVVPTTPIPQTNTVSCDSPFTQKLHFGSYGDEVKKVQQFLKDKGYFFGRITGFYGFWTNQSVKDFQQAYSKEILVPLNLIKPTGNWSYSTMGLANNLLCTQ